MSENNQGAEHDSGAHDEQNTERRRGNWRGDDSNFRGRENNEPWDEDADLPPMTRRRSNRFVTFIGFLAIAIVAGALIFMAFSKPAGNERKQDDHRANNRLPQLTLPDFAPPPPPPAAVASAAEPEEDPWAVIIARKMGGNLVQAGGGGSDGGSRGAGLVPEATRQADMAPMSESERVAYLMSLNGQGGAAGGAQGGSGASGGGSGTALGGALKATDTDMAKAAVLPNRDFILAKGASLDCALETALNSSVPGLATCRLTRDVYSDNGRVLLLDRGSQLVGEYQGGMRTGQNRMFLLWNRVKTPSGVVVKLDSPATDALGRGGMTGFVDRHFWERFGTAILTSIVMDGIQVVLNDKKGGSNNTNIFMNSANSGAEVVKQMLEQSSNIPPTLIVNQGAHTSVLVARDLDFSDVYSLRAKQ